MGEIDYLDPTILTVDDDVDALDVYGHIFERHGYHVLRATDGNQWLPMSK